MFGARRMLGGMTATTIATVGMQLQDALACERDRRAEVVAWLHARLDWEDRMRQLNAAAESSARGRVG